MSRTTFLALFGSVAALSLSACASGGYYGGHDRYDRYDGSRYDRDDNPPAP